MRACVRGGRPTWGWAEVGSAAASGEGPTLVAVGDSEGQLYLLQFGTQVRARDAAAARRRCCLSFRGGCTAPVAAACRRPALNAGGGGGREGERGPPGSGHAALACDSAAAAAAAAAAAGACGAQADADAAGPGAADGLLRHPVRRLRRQPGRPGRCASTAECMFNGPSRGVSLMQRVRAESATRPLLSLSTYADHRNEQRERGPGRKARKRRGQQRLISRIFNTASPM